jgi:hypothetical protein
VTVQQIEGASAPPAVDTRLHRYRPRWTALLGHVGKWLLAWYLVVVCLSFYPFALLWRIGSGEIGGVLWAAVTFTTVGLVARDVRREIARNRR